ncbi:uncharacterized protein IUM83_18386 [Phytophthora cinnamomi]|uniref:uncharacterized protein n=1 Tax=Phytophthora cinnamomi TaxID=4785 RepID=UPI00355AA646|nr:hypothetical protein IUM83_18386 [Phytophthora cinnamomi]
MRRIEQSYSIKKKCEALAVIDQVGIKDASRILNIARGTLHDWTKQAEAIRGFTGNATSKTLKGQGRKEIFPCVSEVLTYMKDVRRHEHVLSTAGIIAFMWKIQPEWMTTYLNEKEKGTLALERMVQRLANRNVFSSQKLQSAKTSYEDLEEPRAEFALSFWAKYEAFGGGGVLNVDETAILFDMPPIKSWVGNGRRDSARILGANKHAGRMMTVLTVRDDGIKLLILFIIRGVPGGRLEQGELEEYPEGHFYTVQEKAWMDSSV